MDIEIKKLSPALLEDWLEFFDNTASPGDGEWEGCYCMCYHWNDELEKRKSWNCLRADAPYNRKCAIEFINAGKMQGYLAYHNGKAIGWCNANDKQAYDNVNFRLPSCQKDKGKKIKSIVCFCITPEYRGKRIATSLLEAVCANASIDGYELVEAYPFEHDEYYAFHGPTSLYIKNGFTAVKKSGEVVVLQKQL